MSQSKVKYLKDDDKPTSILDKFTNKYYYKGRSGVLTSGKYFNKGVKALDAADVGHVVRETTDKIIVFGKKKERYDIHISEIQQVGANVLIGLSLFDIVERYKVA
ncbi:MAG: hypothetical protein ACRD8Z_22685 [Nitrososphaeraceae archaeon]